MNKRHQEQLLSRLDDLFTKGVTFIAWPEIYYWYSIERIAKAPWRDIKSKWADVLEEAGEKYQDPYVAETTAGVALFYSSKPKKLGQLTE
ncbi:MAG: hypothetical protein KIG95_08315 [Comamonas sp.]|nr:hypothetical protein [Comamonas sp.]